MAREGMTLESRIRNAPGPSSEEQKTLTPMTNDFTRMLSTSWGTPISPASIQAF